MLHLRGIKKCFSNVTNMYKELRKLEHWVPENHPLKNFNEENDKKKTSLKTMF